METEPTPPKKPVAKIILGIYLFGCLLMFCDGLFGCKQDIKTSGPYGSFSRYDKPSEELREKECLDSIRFAVTGTIVYFIFIAAKKKPKEP